MADIIKEIIKMLPSDKIVDSCYEGANIVLYTKDKEFFLDSRTHIRKAVDEFKKRIELRPDPKICMDQDKTRTVIEKLMPKECGYEDVVFDPQRSTCIIEVEKPGLAIGKQGSILREMREKTLWIPIVRRTPAIKCDIIKGIRNVLYENNDYRRKFLDKVGHRIYDGWTKEKRKEWVRVTFLGGARQVGRSCLLLQTPESNVLLDCGLDVAASEKDMFPFLDAPEFKIEEIDAIIITDSQLDHSGLVPLLFRYGYTGPVYCTEATRDVMSLLQLDLIKIAVAEGKEPLYSAEEVKQAVKNTICLQFEEVTDVTPDVRITLYNSGHILGSSMVHLHIGNGLHNLLYSGDLKLLDSRLLSGAATKFPRLETAIIEATYGGRDCKFTSREDAEKEISQYIIDTIKGKGKVLLPVLGSGRAQELMLIIEYLVNSKKLPKIPVYVDGSVWDITAIHTAYPEFMNSTLKKQIFHKDTNPFLNPIFKHVENQKERQEIINADAPCIILATSGMLTGGPSVTYFRGLARDKKNMMIFTSYLSDGSIAKRIVQGDRDIGFDAGYGKRQIVKVEMRAVRQDGFSGHASRDELIGWVDKASPRPRKVIINHGESKRILDLASTIHKQFRIETSSPRNLESIRIR